MAFRPKNWTASSASSAEQHCGWDSTLISKAKSPNPTGLQPNVFQVDDKAQALEQAGLLPHVANSARQVCLQQSIVMRLAVTGSKQHRDRNT